MSTETHDDNARAEAVAGASAAADWTEVRVAVPAGWEDLVASILAEAPGTGASIGAIASDSEPPPSGRVWVRTYIDPQDATPTEGIAPARRALEERVATLPERVGDDELAGLRIEFRPLEAHEWEGYWRSFWKPFRVGRIAIVTTDYEAPLKPTDHRVVLEPGRAFGTGRHPTTRTCILSLQHRLRPGDRVLDCGSGSGILSVAAARFGASVVDAFDVHPHAGSVFDRLTRDNGVAKPCRFRHGGFEVVDPTERYHAVLANISPEVIEAHAGDLAQALTDDGWLAASGCPVKDQDAVRSYLLAAGLVIDEEIVRGRWCTFLCRLGS